MNDFIKLHPKNYKEVSDKVIFYINEQKVSQNNFESIVFENYTNNHNNRMIFHLYSKHHWHLVKHQKYIEKFF